MANDTVATQTQLTATYLSKPPPLKPPPTKVPMHGCAQAHTSFMAARRGVPSRQVSHAPKAPNVPMLSFRVCLARNARCNTMSHLTADAVSFAHVSRETPDVTPCHSSPPQGVKALGQTDAGTKPAAGCCQSYIRKGILRQGNRLFCKELLCFNTMPCCQMPLLVHF